jgi:phage terminase Nu1 subunit (DNA packaging protein)
MSRDEFVVDTLTAVQRFFSISRTAAKEWKNTGMPVREDGRYDLKAIHDWWLASEKYQYAVSAGQLKSEDDLKRAKLQIEVDHNELKYLRARGELVNRDAAKAAISQLFHRVRSRLSAAPEELASSLPADVRTGYIEDAKHRVALILREMQLWSFEKEVEEGGSEEEA